MDLNPSQSTKLQLEKHCCKDLSWGKKFKGFHSVGYNDLLSLLTCLTLKLKHD